jgi:TolA-binding protein
VPPGWPHRWLQLAVWLYAAVVLGTVAVLGTPLLTHAIGFWPSDVVGLLMILGGVYLLFAPQGSLLRPGSRAAEDSVEERLRGVTRSLQAASGVMADVERELRARQARLESLSVEYAQVQQLASVNPEGRRRHPDRAGRGGEGGGPALLLAGPRGDQHDQPARGRPGGDPPAASHGPLNPSTRNLFAPGMREPALALANQPAKPVAKILRIRRRPARSSPRQSLRATPAGQGDPAREA